MRILGSTGDIMVYLGLGDRPVKAIPIELTPEQYWGLRELFIRWKVRKARDFINPYLEHGRC